MAKVKYFTIYKVVKRVRRGSCLITWKPWFVDMFCVSWDSLKMPRISCLANCVLPPPNFDGRFTNTDLNPDCVGQMESKCFNLNDNLQLKGSLGCEMGQGKLNLCRSTKTKTRIETEKNKEGGKIW